MKKIEYRISKLDRSYLETVQGWVVPKATDKQGMPVFGLRKVDRCQWTIDHIPSGARIATLDITKCRAVRTAQDLYNLSPYLWGLDDPKFLESEAGVLGLMDSIRETLWPGVTGTSKPDDSAAQGEDLGDFGPKLRKLAQIEGYGNKER